MSRILIVLFLLLVGCARPNSYSAQYASEWRSVDLNLPRGSWSAAADPTRDVIWILACSSEGSMTADRSADLARVDTTTSNVQVTSLPGSCSGPSSKSSGISQDALDVDSTGTVWGLLGGMVISKSPNGAVETFPIPPERDTRVRGIPPALEVADEGTIWVSSPSELRVLNPKTKAWQTVTLPGHRETSGRIMQLPDGRLALSGRRSEETVTIVDGRLRLAVPTAISPRSFTVMPNGDLAFINSEGKLTLYNPTTRVSTATQVTVRAPTSLRSDVAITRDFLSGTSLTTAPDGAVWVRDAGQLEEGSAAFIRYEVASGTSQRLLLPDVRKYSIGGSDAFLAPGSLLLFARNGDAWLLAGDASLGPFVNFADAYVLELRSRP